MVSVGHSQFLYLDCITVTPRALPAALCTPSILGFRPIFVTNFLPKPKFGFPILVLVINLAQNLIERKIFWGVRIMVLSLELRVQRLEVQV